MFRRLLIASVCTTMLAVAAPTSAETPTAASASTDRAQVPVKKVVRQYGDGPVALKDGQRLMLTFDGKRGDRVRLGSQYRNPANGKPYYGSLDEDLVSLRRGRATSRPDAAGFFRLRETGSFTLTYRHPSVDGVFKRVQLFKQTIVDHVAQKTTHIPQRLGVEYAARLRVPRNGMEVTTFGRNYIRGVVSRGHFSSPNAEQALVLAPGQGVYADESASALTKPLKAREAVLALIDTSTPASIRTTVPIEAGRVALDGSGVALPAGGTRAVVAELDAAELAGSAQRLLHVAIPGELARFRWNVLVLPATGPAVEPAPPALRSSSEEALFQLPETTGTYRVLAFPGDRHAPAAELQLDAVADGGTVALDGPAVTVPARADGRYTLLAITQPQEFMASTLTVSDVTVAPRWSVYAGRLTSPDCSGDVALGCGDGNGVALTQSGANGPINGGYLLTMPDEGQATGSFTVQMTSVRRS